MAFGFRGFSSNVGSGVGQRMGFAVEYPTVSDRGRAGWQLLRPPAFARSIIMGAAQTLCRKCGSTHVRGRCDCPDGEFIDLVQCAYCGTHTNPGSIEAGKCGQCRVAQRRQGWLTAHAPESDQ